MLATADRTLVLRCMKRGAIELDDSGENEMRKNEKNVFLGLRVINGFVMLLSYENETIIRAQHTGDRKESSLDSRLLSERIVEHFRGQDCKRVIF